MSTSYYIIKDSKFAEVPFAEFQKEFSKLAEADAELFKKDDSWIATAEGDYMHVDVDEAGQTVFGFTRYGGNNPDLLLEMFGACLGPDYEIVDEHDEIVYDLMAEDFEEDNRNN